MDLPGQTQGCVFHANFPFFFFPLQCYRDLALVSRDGMNIVLNKINHILMEKYLKLQDTCRTQVRDPPGSPGISCPTWSGRSRGRDGNGNMGGSDPEMSVSSWCGCCGSWSRAGCWELTGSA